MQSLKSLFKSKKPLFTFVFLLSLSTVQGQVQTQIVGDSVRLSSNNGPGELILENSTKNVLGFLYNKGNGRTEFRKGMIKLNDSVYVFGDDTLDLNRLDYWRLTGNLNNSASSFLGTLDDNPLTIKTNNIQRMSVKSNGVVDIASDDLTSKPVFRFFPSGDFSSNATNNYGASSTIYKNGLRYHSRLGYLEIGTSNYIDTSVSNLIANTYQTSSIILNSDDPNYINGQLLNSFIGAYNVRLKANQGIRYSMLTGGSFFLGGSLFHVVGGGVYHTISEDVNGSLIMGNSQYIQKNDNNSGWLGFNNRNIAKTRSCLVTGFVNSFGSDAQFTAGSRLINKSFAASVLGNSNVDFTSLYYMADSAWAGIRSLSGNDLLLAVGNSGITDGSVRSNALSMLYNGRTQINTTGFTNNLVENDVKPKAAFEVVSTNSGVLLPKLTSTQRDAIANADLYSGLLFFNTDLNAFQYYSGTIWKTISDQDAPITNVAVIDFPTTGSNMSSDHNITVSGASDGDIVSIGVPNASTTSNSNYTAWVSATNTVTIRFNNYSNATIDPAQGSFKVKVIK